jgi:hypothetical protein
MAEVMVPVMVAVDVLTVRPPELTVPEPVLQALHRQGVPRLTHYLVDGPRQPGERAIRAIVRARNLARRQGSSPYAMFLDSDVVLPDYGVEALVYNLRFNPTFGALGISYQNEPEVRAPARHVAMGAILIRREVLERLCFRIEPGRCECLCCCDDIRGMGLHVGYVPGMRATHLDQ